MYIQSPLHVSSDKHSFLFKKKKKEKQTDARQSISRCLKVFYQLEIVIKKREKERDRDRSFCRRAKQL